MQWYPTVRGKAELGGRTETRDFGLLDKRGRRIGAAVWTCSVDFIPRPEGTTWTSRVDVGRVIEVRIQAQRGGRDYGPYQGIEYFATEAEATKHIEAKLKAMAKRYERGCANGSV